MNGESLLRTYTVTGERKNRPRTYLCLSPLIQIFNKNL